MVATRGAGSGTGMALVLIMKVATPRDQQKEPCPRPHHRLLTLRYLPWPRLPRPARCPARACSPRWWMFQIRAGGVGRHHFGVVLGLAACAALAGCRSF